MSDVHTGGPAFPMGYHRDGNSADHQGMTLRDYFAGQAMAALSGYVIQPDGGTEQDLADICYRVADAMIRARNRI